MDGWQLVTLVSIHWRSSLLNPYSIEIFLYKPLRPKVFSRFEICINILVSSFWFIWISVPMLWVYAHCKYFNSFSAGRQNLTLKDGPRAGRVNMDPTQIFYLTIIFYFSASLCSWLGIIAVPQWRLTRRVKNVHIYWKQSGRHKVILLLPGLSQIFVDSLVSFFLSVVI